MKRLYYLITLVIVCSCANQPKCDEDETKSLVIGVYEKGLAEYLANDVDAISKKFNYEITVDPKAIAKSFLHKSSIQLHNVYTTKRDKDLYTCDCKADLKLQLGKNFSEEVIENYKTISKPLDEQLLSELHFRVEQEIFYSAQVTDDKDTLIVNTTLVPEVKEAFEKFTALYLINEIALTVKSNEGNR